MKMNKSNAPGLWFLTVSTGAVLVSANMFAENKVQTQIDFCKGQSTTQMKMDCCSMFCTRYQTGTGYESAWAACIFKLFGKASSIIEKTVLVRRDCARTVA